jgi:competence protein ComEC
MRFKGRACHFTIIYCRGFSMLLHDTGETTPLVVVFAGTCLGILVSAKDMAGILFCLLFVFFLFSRKAIFPLCLGIVLGSAAMFAAPCRLDIQEGDCAIKGRIEEAGFMQGTYRVILEDVSINGFEAPGLAMLNVYGRVREPGRGCTLQGNVHLKPWLGRGNLGEPDYGLYMLTQGITASGYVKDMGQVAISGTGRKDLFRSGLVSALAKDARPEAEILSAALTGDRSGLVPSLQDSFSALGITHLIAISGLNMGVVFLMGYFMAFFVLRLTTPFARRFDTPLWAKFAGLTCVVLYTLFVGYSPPAVRACIMVCTAVASLLVARRQSLLESLALAGILILAWMPWSLYSASFLLSFAAVLGITGVTDKLKGQPAWLMIPAIPLVSSAFTSPLVMYLFGFLSPVSMVANILLVPWFSFVIMPLGMAGFAVFPFSGGISSWLLSLAYDGTGLMLRASDIFGSLEPVPRPGMFWVMTCFAGLVASFFSRPCPWRTIFLCTCSLLIIALPIRDHLVRSSQGLAFDFINVGQADCILITKGMKAMLIDAGSPYPGPDAGRTIIGPHLLRRGITQLDLVIMTHSHPDHIGGMPFILKHFKTHEVWTNVADDPSPDFQSALCIAKRKTIPVKCVRQGDSCHLGGIYVQVFSPPGRIGQKPGVLDLNLNSLVVRAGDEGLRGLFMADSWGLGEIRLCRLPGDIKADVLKVAHHGSKGSCLDMFLQRVRPKVAVIQVGRRNLYRLPHERALQRLRDHGIEAYRTDMNGEVMVLRDKMQMHIKLGLFPADNIIYSAASGTQ